jgi:uncharacterized protein (TIGR03067 family)
MSNRMRWTGAALTFVALALVGIVSAGGGVDDLKQMQGKWSATIAEIDGRPASKEEMNLKLVLTVEGDNYRVLAGEQAISAGQLKLDAGKTPRTIDTTHTEGPFKGIVQKGIYELKGDTMVAAFAKPGDDRPTAFKTKEGSKQSIVRYVRIKK